MFKTRPHFAFSEGGAGQRRPDGLGPDMMAAIWPNDPGRQERADFLVKSAQRQAKLRR
jgi:hypothetical protein